MSFARVEQDGVEFYTLRSNGASGMSISGLARLCGVRDKSIKKILNSIARHSVRSERLKRFIGKDLYLVPNGPKGALIVRAEVCSAIIRYYAIESEAKTETALYSYDKFADIGMEKWIQGITGWTPQITAEVTHEQVDKYIHDRLPKTKLAVAIHPGEIVRMLQECNFSADGYRLYFYLEMMTLQNQQPDVQTICQDLDISRQTFRKWLPEIHDWSDCADWLELHTRKGPEFDIQRRLQQELGGKMEAYTAAGPVDLLTKTEIIEIKRIEDWKTAFGQVMAKSLDFPDRGKRIHLFGESSKQLKKITGYCQPFDVAVTFEQSA